MSYRRITINQVQVIGFIWEPGDFHCSMTYNLSPSQVEDIKALGNGDLNREAVQHWLGTNSGDFQSIEDFRVDIEDFLSDWANPESEYIFLDCMDSAEC